MLLPFNLDAMDAYKCSKKMDQKKISFVLNKLLKRNVEHQHIIMLSYVIMVNSVTHQVKMDLNAVILKVVLINALKDTICVIMENVINQ